MGRSRRAPRPPANGPVSDPSNPNLLASVPRPTRKRKVKHDQGPSVRISPKHFKRSSSIISITSSDGKHVPPIPSSSKADAEYWSQQPDFDSDISDGDLLALTQEEPVKVETPSVPPVVEENRPAGDYGEPTLCKEQQDLLDLIMSGCNVFFTGSAGCGKSTVLKAAVRKLREQHKTVYIVAPTGKAALGVNGITTWSYMGWTPDLYNNHLDVLKEKTWRASVGQRLKETDVLVIDEISMVENTQLERINECMKHIRCYHSKFGTYPPDAPAFGGVQLIITGDFCQLPPVKPFATCYDCRLIRSKSVFKCHPCRRSYKEPEKWAFKSSAWAEAKLTTVHLNEIHRQNDREFVRMLQKCRLGLPFTPSERRILENHPCDVTNATQLYCWNNDVEQINFENFDALEVPETCYAALDGFKRQREHEELIPIGELDENGIMKGLKDHPLDAAIEMKEGALVMLRVNLDLEKGLCNGSQGIISGWEKFDFNKLPKTYKRDKDLPFDPDVLGGDFARLRENQIRHFAISQGVKHWPIVKFHNGVERPIYPWCVVNALGATEPYSLLHRTQVPLTLAWALSIHKSQGMTLNRVITNLDGAWIQALKYVALSRVTSIHGLKVEGKRSLSVTDNGDGEVRKFLVENFGLELFK
ncbi:hypothetical protein F53441_4600 [Fusarium austroafricanum]|uniref:ATP-dependent DNA helicase n=1 Tax=Fusarium austroafricanum TaxID=2364996 RepID=A0A8H4P1K1_9HYPO|nr:hypothetical protein F53441_4600 [Fusarium austroafricanum]